jgi:hypothetical protein
MERPNALTVCRTKLLAIGARGAAARFAPRTAQIDGRRQNKLGRGHTVGASGAVSHAQHEQFYNANADEQRCERHGIVFEQMPCKHGVYPLFKRQVFSLG